MLVEFLDRVLSLGKPNLTEIGGDKYTDKELTRIVPPAPSAVDCSTLHGLVDLHDNELDDAKSKGDLLVHIVSPTEVALISREADKYARRRVWAKATYPAKIIQFPFGTWHAPEAFIIAAQAGFQRAKIEQPDGSWSPDLDYVLKAASSVTAEQVQSHEDDGFTQRVAAKSGVVLPQADRQSGAVSHVRGDQSSRLRVRVPGKDRRILRLPRVVRSGRRALASLGDGGDRGMVESEVRRRRSGNQLMDVKICDFCGVEIRDGGFSVSVFDRKNDRDVIDRDACASCKRAVIGAFEKLDQNCPAKVEVRLG